jgi:general secretion pathway protein L
VRVALVRTSYRRTTLEALGEADVGWAGSEAEAIRAAVGAARPEACAIAVSGEKSFYRRLELPAAAQKEINNVLAYEIESTVPFEMDDAVFDYRILRGVPADDAHIPVFAAIARTEDVRGRIQPVREALGIEPERVGTGPLPLANLATLAPEIEKPAVPGPIAILDVGDHVSEIVVLLGDEPVFARTLSRGTAGLPESAHALARELRQTLTAWRTTGGDPLVGLYLTGPGAAAPGAAHFIGTELGVAILPLPPLKLELTNPEDQDKIPRFAKALALALGLAGRAKGLNLRRGALEAERSYPFLREKIPLFSGLAAVILVSFGFSTFAELRALDAEHAVLVAKLGAATKEVLGDEITDPDKAKSEIDSTAKVAADEDPLPRVDGFDVMVQLSKAVPTSIVHDVVELDDARGHVVIQGIVPTVADAETVAKNLKEFRCFKDVKTTRVNALSEGKQKYSLEFDLKCEDKKAKKPSTAEPDGSAQPAASAASKPEKDSGKDGGQ